MGATHPQASQRTEAERLEMLRPGLDLGAPTHIVARVGNDSAGIAVLSEFDAAGISHGDSVISGERTGVVVVLVDKSGERTMFPETGANSGLKVTDLPELSPFAMVYLSGYALLDEVSRPGVIEMIEVINSRNIPIFFDPATVGGMSQVKLTEVQSWLPLMRGLFMNEEEATFLTGETDLQRALDALLTCAPLAVIKRGSLGAIAQVRGENSISIPAEPTTVIDTTGAGDSFAGGYIAQWLRGGDLHDCLHAGAVSAARCVAIVGARPQVTPAL